MTGRLAAAVATGALLAGITACSTAGTGNPAAPVVDIHTIQPPPVSPYARVQAWFVGISADYDATLADLTAISGDSDAAAVGVDCGKLGVDVARLQGDPAAPDAAIDAEFQSALTAAATSAAACVAGDYTVSSAAISSFGTHTATMTLLVNGLPR